MYKCIELNKEFETKEELFKALKENKKDIITSKKMQTKQADSVSLVVKQSSKEKSNKEGVENTEDINKLNAVLAINTINLYDSHSDVHVKGIWSKSVKEQRNLYLLQEHKMTFDHIISGEVEAKVEEMTWKSLGFDFEGSTEVLVFNAEINKNRNEYMFQQYAKGYVKEHSVGMRYVKIDLAINSESEWDKDEKEVWDKYYQDIANKDDVDVKGYFWAVTEAKIIEGSAVVKGSNYATPTISIEPSNDTQEEKEAVKNDTSANSLLI